MTEFLLLDEDYRVAVPVYWGEELSRQCIGLMWVMKSEVDAMRRDEGKMSMDKLLRETGVVHEEGFFYIGHFTQGVGLTPVWNWTNCQSTIVYEGTAVDLRMKKPEPTILGNGAVVTCPVSNIGT